MAEFRQPELLLQQHPALLAVGGLLLVWLVKLVMDGRRKKVDVPIYKLHQGETPKQAMVNGPKKFGTQPFLLTGLNKFPDTVVIPMALAEEIKSLPESQISFNTFVMHNMVGEYTGVGDVQPNAIKAIKNELTRNIAKVLSDLQDEVNFVFDWKVKDAPEWRSIELYPTILEVVAGLSARTFVGLPLCRDKEWLDASITFTGDIMRSVSAIKDWPTILRPFVHRFLPELCSLRAYKAFGARKLQPHADALRMSHDGKSNAKRGVTSGDDDRDLNMINWILNYYDDPKSVSATKLGEMQMGISFAAIHTTSMTLSHAIFDLAAHPEYIPELRAEIEEVLNSENHPERRLEKTSMPKLRKLDSFIKESQRINPPGNMHVNREVTAKGGLTLSNGLYLPKGTTVSTSHPYSPGLNPKGTLMTTEKSPSLDVFYPWRYSEIRSIPGQENGHQFVTTSADSPVFGMGQHACPGRFFASNEIKVVLVELLKRFDIGLGPNGEGVAAGYERPKCIKIGFADAIDPEAQIMIRDRKVHS